MGQPAEMTAEATFALLRTRSFLGALPDSDLQALARCGHVMRYSKGHCICRRGDDGGSLSIVLTGSVKISNVSPSGRETILYLVLPGDVIGEVAALDGGDRSADATALNETQVFVVYRRDILPILARNPEALMELVNLLCEKLRLASEIVEDNQRPMRGRLAKGLLRLARQHGATRRQCIELDLGITQRDLGNYLGLSRESTSRQLGVLGHEGLIAIAGGKILITDMTALTETADIDES
jgi:CRP-like cAMP-binding protein